MREMESGYWPMASTITIVPLMVNLAAAGYILADSGWCSMAGHQNSAADSVALFPLLVSSSNICITGGVQRWLFADIAPALSPVCLQLLVRPYLGNVTQLCKPNRLLLH